MKLRIPLSDGTMLEFDGQHDELVRIAEEFVQKRGGAVAPNAKLESPPHDAEAAKNGRRWNAQTAKRLVATVWGEQLKVLRFVVKAGGRVTYQQIEQHMGYKAQKLSGVLSSLTRNCKAATGDRFAKVLDWRIRQDGEREYYIDRDALPLLKAVLND